MEMIWTYAELFPDRIADQQAALARHLNEQYEVRIMGKFPVAAICEPGAYTELKTEIKTKGDWKLIDQGIQPRRVIRLEE